MDASTVDPGRAEHASLPEYLRSVLRPDQLERVLLVSFSQWEINSSVVAEVAATLQDMGEHPLVALWSDDTPLPDVGWTTSHALARLFVSPARDDRVRRALRRFGLPSNAFPAPPVRNWSPAVPLPQVGATYRSALRELTYRDAAVGRAILQVHPDSDTPVTDEHLWPRQWVEESVESFAWAFDQVSRLISDRQVTALVVFNGRFLHDSAAAAAAEQAGLPFLSFDFGGNDSDFDLTIDSTHDWSALQRRMLTMYHSWDPQTRDVIGGSWFEERRQHVDPRNTLFTASQTVGQGVERPEGKRLIVYFSSSGDEISELDLDWGEYFHGQPGALLAVSEACRDLGDCHLLVRTHPHKKHKPRRDVEDWHAAVAEAGPDEHLDEHSDVDSYTLMRQADAVVTYGSTTGVEAAYAGCPVIVMGPSAYDELGCATRVTDVDGLRAALATPTPGDWAGAVSYGLMMRRRGFMNRFVTRVDGQEMLAGVRIRDSRPLVLKLSDWVGKRRRARLARHTHG